MYDNSPSYTGHILQKYYDTSEKIERLISGGLVNVIKSTPELCCYKHRADGKIPEDCKPETLQDLEHYKRQILQRHFDYSYLYEDGERKVCEPRQLPPA